MSTQEVVIDEIKRVAAEQKKTLAPLDRDSELLSIGLDSLCFAILVARLEERFDFDPFSAGDDFVLPVTVGDFVDLYEHAPA
jgi:acyl carrier protein